MPPRQQGEPTFADDEELYRRLRWDWLDGIDAVNSEAVDLQGTSVDRSMYAATPADCVPRCSGEEIAIGAIKFADVPPRFIVPKATAYESVVVYLPEEKNDAHSEIRFHKEGDREPSKPQSKPLKSKIRNEVAARIRVVHRR